jgi:hypothetical protein
MYSLSRTKLRGFEAQRLGGGVGPSYFGALLLEPGRPDLKDGTHSNESNPDAQPKITLSLGNFRSTFTFQQNGTLPAWVDIGRQSEKEQQNTSAEHE